MLKGKNAIVTGSTSGIGLGIARALAHEGANIMINGFGRESEVECTCQELAKETVCNIHFSGADMSKPPAIREMIKEANEAFGGIDILVNNVGIQYIAPIEDLDEEKWDAIIAINLSSAFHTTKAVLPYMRQQKWGRIINIASTHGLVGTPLESAYVTAKHGLVGFTKAIALETAQDGITCNAICPGYVWSPLLEKQAEYLADSRNISTDQVIEKILLAEHPTKEFVTVEQLEALTLFLCSDHGRNLTGTALPVDGGWTAH